MESLSEDLPINVVKDPSSKEDADSDARSRMEVKISIQLASYISYDGKSLYFLEP